MSIRMNRNNYDDMIDQAPEPTDVIDMIKNCLAHSDLSPPEQRLIRMADKFLAPDKIGFRIDKNEHTLIDNVDGLLWPLRHTTKPGDVIYLSLNQLPSKLANMFALAIARGTIEKQQRVISGNVFDRFASSIFGEKRQLYDTPINDDYVAVTINGKSQLVRNINNQQLTVNKAPALERAPMFRDIPISQNNQDFSETDSENTPISMQSVAEALPVSPTTKSVATRVSTAKTTPVKRVSFEEKHEHPAVKSHHLDFDEIQTDANTKVRPLRESLEFADMPTMFITPNGSRYVAVEEGNITIYYKIPGHMLFRYDDDLGVYILD